MKTNTEKYFNMIMAEMISVIQPKKMVKNEELKQAVMNTLLDEDGPRSVSKSPEPKAVFVTNRIFRGFYEINSSVKSLENIEIYVRRFPFKKLRYAGRAEARRLTPRSLEK